MEVYMKNTIKLFGIIALAAIIGFAMIGCDGDGGGGDDDPIDPIDPPGVYIAGYYVDADDNSIACYWKDGVKKDLTNPSEMQALGDLITVANGRIYVAGSYEDEDNDGYCYWTVNGTTITKTSLTDLDEFLDISAAGNNVYILGVATDSKPYLWTNGTKGSELVPPTGFENGALSGSDVYVVGRTNTNSWYQKGVSGAKTQLNNANAYIIAVSGNKVYTAGFSGYDNYYWVNTTKTKMNLPADAEAGQSAWTGQIKRIYGSGNNVYMLGSYEHTDGEDYDCYWINSTAYSLKSSLSSLTKPIIYNIAGTGSDAYITGYHGSSGNYKACYWKNGTKTDLPAVTGSPDAEARGIFIVE